MELIILETEIVMKNGRKTVKYEKSLVYVTYVNMEIRN